MDRREMLAAAGSLAVAAVSASALAAEHDHHHHTGHPHQGLIESAAHCLMAGQACQAHCLELLGQGDKEMAACAASVNELLATCHALQQLASQKSKHLGKMAKVALDVCKQCEEQCRKHEKKHQTCRDCAEACAACAKECQKFAA
ncbi:MAG: Csp1 family four helix bundle copper storage protein [Rhodocyclales bacterium]|nr:Csp1 family four helix bundle copper storage protein [Rhodocyclales bacterium]